MWINLWTAVAGYLGFLGVRKLTENASEQEDYIARTIWGEARGEGYSGMQAVANVIMNRVRRGGWYGTTPKDVVLKKLQFSVWNDKDPNKAKMLSVNGSDSKFAMAQQIAHLAYTGQLTDITKGATEYHTKQISPNWDYGKLAQVGTIGNHVFYRSIA